MYNYSPQERLASLEAQVSELRDEQQKMIGKLDELLSIKDKGVGAFWFVSAIFGSGIVASVVAIINMFRGPHG